MTTESRAGAGSVCFHISRCAFKAAALGAGPFPALFLAAFCIFLEEQGGSVMLDRALGDLRSPALGAWSKVPRPCCRYKSFIYFFFLSSLFTFLPRSCRKRARSRSAERKKGAEVGNGSNGVRPSVAFPALRNAETKMFRGARGSVTATEGGSHPLLLQPQWIYLINPIPAGYLRRRISRCLRTYHV